MKILKGFLYNIDKIVEKNFKIVCKVIDCYIWYPNAANSFQKSIVIKLELIYLSGNEISKQLLDDNKMYNTRKLYFVNKSKISKYHEIAPRKKKERKENNNIYVKGRYFVGGKLNTRDFLKSTSLPLNENQLLNYLEIKIGDIIKITNTCLIPELKNGEKEFCFKKLSNSKNYFIPNLFPKLTKIGFFWSFHTTKNKLDDSIKKICVVLIVHAKLNDKDWDWSSSQKNYYLFYDDSLCHLNISKKNDKKIKKKKKISNWSNEYENIIGISSSNPFKDAFEFMKSESDFIYLVFSNIKKEYSKTIMQSEIVEFNSPIILNNQDFHKKTFEKSLFENFENNLISISYDDAIEWIDTFIDQISNKNTKENDKTKFQKGQKNLFDYAKSHLNAQFMLFVSKDYFTIPYLKSRISNSSLFNSINCKNFKLIQNLICSEIYESNKSQSKNSLKNNAKIIYGIDPTWNQKHNIFLNHLNDLDIKKDGGLNFIKKGIYKNAISFDYNSCYPKVFMTYGICPSNVKINPSKYEIKKFKGTLVGTLNVLNNKLPKENNKFEVYVFKSSGRDIIPSVMSKLYNLKVELKNKNAYKSEQIAVKLLLNMTYGNLVYIQCKILSMLACKIQRERLRNLINICNKKELVTIKPIYCHTDSIMISLNNTALYKKFKGNPEMTLKYFISAGIIKDKSLIHVENYFDVICTINKTKYFGKLNEKIIIKGYRNLESAFYKKIMSFIHKNVLSFNIVKLNIKEKKLNWLSFDNFVYCEKIDSNVTTKKVFNDLKNIHCFSKENMINLKISLIKVLNTNDNKSLIHPLMFDENQKINYLEYFKKVDNELKEINQITSKFHKDYRFEKLEINTKTLKELLLNNNSNCDISCEECKRNNIFNYINDDLVEDIICDNVFCNTFLKNNIFGE